MKVSNRGFRHQSRPLELDANTFTAHQIKMTLANLRLSLKLLDEGVYGSLADEQRDIIQKIIAQTESLLSFVRTILEVGAVEEGFPYHIAPCYVEEIANEAAHSFADAMRRKRIAFSLELPYGQLLPAISADRTMLMQAITNLLDNAVRYTPEGGSIAASVSARSGEVVFSIRDSGIGIPKEEQGRIFGKMFRASNARRQDPNGTGMGLFIAKRIALDHGGTVWFESKEGKGSTFFLALPIAQDTATIRNA